MRRPASRTAAGGSSRLVPAIGIAAFIVVIALVGTLMAIPLLATRPQVGASRIGDLTLSVDMSVDADDQYRLELQFADASGAPASPEELTVSATMPEHRMAPMPVTVERQADGRYLAVGKLESYGAWLFRIKTEGGEVGVPLDHPAHF